MNMQAIIQTPADLIAVNGLTVTFPTLAGDNVPVIDDLSLALKPGEILGLVGESGAGKTVLARSLLGLPPRPGRIAGGSIHFDGQNLLDLSPEDLRARRGRELSMIVPNPRAELNPLIAVGEQIATVLRVHRKIAAQQARAAALDMLRAVQIPDPSARYNALPHELSGGMAQRIVIAIALVCSPRFIVSDDATSGLDVTVQAQILELLKDLVSERGSSMLFITRDVGITAHYCDRVAVLYRGQIMELAPRRQFFGGPRHPTTIMLMAAFSHNQKVRELWAKPASTVEADQPGGCLYARRCPLAQDRCRAERPALRELAPGHHVRCHFPVER